MKGELLFSSVGSAKLIHVHWLCSSSKMHHILAQYMFEGIFGFVCGGFSKKYHKIHNFWIKRRVFFGTPPLPVPLYCTNDLWKKINKLLHYRWWKEYSLSDYTNKVILLHKSALWCVAIWQLTNRYMILPGKEAWVNVRLNMTKLDGVGLVDNRPFTNKLHHLVQKMWHVTHDMWHKTRDTWHVTCNMWHVACDMWHMTHDMLWEVKIHSRVQLPSSYSLWFMIFWRFGGKCWRTQLSAESITKVFVEQPRLHRVWWLLHFSA